MGMNLSHLPDAWRQQQLKNAAHFTRKPRGFSITNSHVPFLPMDLIPIGRTYVTEYKERATSQLGSGTYIEQGDVLVAKITPCFENQKQAIVDIGHPYGFATTEVIPLKGKPQLTETLFLHYVLLHPGLRQSLASQMDGSTNRQRLRKEVLQETVIPIPPLEEQRQIATLLSAVQRAIEQQERLIALTTELKKALMHKLFTEGTRGEEQKQTEIGPVPKSWDVATIGSTCNIKASAMTYKQLAAADNVTDGVRVMGVKVSDMNIEGNEIEFRTANLEKHISQNEAQRRTVPANAIVFPKRGAAIATNKKRLTTSWTVLDPNLIAIVPAEGVSHRYLYHWFNTFDLARITDPGPTPQLNKKDLIPLKFPMPEFGVQKEIAEYIDTVDKKIGEHEHRKAALLDLFRALLHQLMTAQIRVNEIDLSELGHEPVAAELEEAI